MQKRAQSVWTCYEAQKKLHFDVDQVLKVGLAGAEMADEGGEDSVVGGPPAGAWAGVEGLGRTGGNESGR